jgi:alcohol dehydrogenase
MSAAGSLDRLRHESEHLDGPPPGSATVAVEAIGLNFADIFAALGLYSATPQGPFIPGLECAGTVVGVGDGVASVCPGQRVFGLTRFGAYATAVNIDVRYLRPLPPGWTAADGAAYPVQALTAWYAIRELGALRPGGCVLVQSAAGGVGLNALEILRTLDARVVATVGHESKRPLLVDDYGVPAAQVIVRDPHRFGRQLDGALAAAGCGGFDLVLDSVAGPFLTPAYLRLSPAGRLVIFGAADLMPRGGHPNWLRLGWHYLTRPRLDPLQMISANCSVMGFNLIWLWDQVDQLAPAYADLDRLITRPPRIGRRFPFDEAPAAMRYLQSGNSVGKVVLEVTRQHPDRT